MAAVAVWGGAAVLSGTATPERDRVADLPALAALDAAALGGAGPLAERLDAALHQAVAARRGRFGRAPALDVEALASAGADLERVAEAAPPGSAVAEEARLALGRVLLASGRDAEAARALGALVRRGGYRASEARRLLDWLRTDRAGGAG